MPAAVHLRLDTHPRLAAHVKRADAFGAISLVSTEGHQVDLELLQVYFDFTGRLCRVDVEYNLIFARDFTDRLDILDHADLVIHVHYRNQDCLVGYRRFQLVEV